MKDPYEALDISKDATPEAIKKAYRKAAKKKHPDSGGQTEEMAEIAQAYMILSNPEKKKQFDETGDVGPDDTQSKIYAEFCQICAKILLEQENLPVLDNLKRFTDGSEGQYAEQKRKINHQKKLIEKAKARIVSAPENDILGAMLAQQEADIERQVAQWDKAIMISRAAIAMFKEYQFKEPEPSPGWGIYMTGIFPNTTKV